MKKKNEKQEGPVLWDAPEEGKTARSPLVWALLLAVPLILGIVVSVVRNNESASGVAPEAIAAAAQPATVRDGPDAAAGDSSAPMRRMAAVPEEEAYPCDFEPWLGLKVSPDMLEAIKQARRDHRILPPGAPMTMDYSGSRINFDVDDKGVITRIWCG